MDKEKIKQFLEQYGPMTIAELEDYFPGAKDNGEKIVKDLLKDGQIRQIKSEKREYYDINKTTTNDDLANIRNIYSDEIVKVRDRVDDLDEKIKVINSKIEEIQLLEKDITSIRNKINSIYANLIGIMAIFVALFSYITINVNWINKLLGEINKNSILVFVLSNLVLLGGIVALIVAIKLLLIDVLKKS